MLPQRAVEARVARPPARSTRAAGRCRRRDPAACGPDVSTPSGATKRSSSACGALRPQPTQVRIGVGLTQRGSVLLGDRRLDGGSLGSAAASGSGSTTSADSASSCGSSASAAASATGLAVGVRRLGLLGLLDARADSGRRPATLELLAGGLALGELLVRGDAAEARAGQRRVRAALAVREDRDAAAGELLARVAAAERGLGLGLGELGVGLDVDLPAGQARGEAGVQALLADRERELVVGDDDRRLLGLVVDVDLAHARGRERLRDEARRLRVPRDDVDLLAAELGDDHAHARAARADAGADRVDALGVRLDGDLRAVARLAGDAADLDEAVGDLGHLELEQRLDQLGIAAREDHLRALRARSGPR